MTPKTPGAGTTLTAPGQTPAAGVGGEAHPSGGSHAWRTPAPDLPVTREELLLSALSDAAEDRRHIGDCEDCVLDVGAVKLCGDHERDTALAAAYDALYQQILSEGAGVA